MSAFEQKKTEKINNQDDLLQCWIHPAVAPTASSKRQQLHQSSVGLHLQLVRCALLIQGPQNQQQQEQQEGRASPSAESPR